jgi:hypothetical protein
MLDLHKYFISKPEGGGEAVIWMIPRGWEDNIKRGCEGIGQECQMHSVGL